METMRLLPCRLSEAEVADRLAQSLALQDQIDSLAEERDQWAQGVAKQAKDYRAKLRELDQARKAASAAKRTSTELRETPVRLRLASARRLELVRVDTSEVVEAEDETAADVLPGTEHRATDVSGRTVKIPPMLAKRLAEAIKAEKTLDVEVEGVVRTLVGFSGAEAKR